ncbi:MAG: hypothetical protein KKF46_04610 [Nanoarchaeota archaeon]|nr:hypothetical protein [Nanoarchaeota archaeon]MBU1321615.1 hypothetical protein [Nanoarchaeota archaeon]MBU1597990.1 hypothetical protein [Nanoarchaeota archaeon]MBU2440941.1 hypothetical protein [Nanoarchaeota archaeon]
MLESYIKNQVSVWLNKNDLVLDGSLVKNMDRVFTSVRDIPFQVFLRKHDYKNNILQTISNNYGSCSGKHFLLGNILDQAGVPVKYMLYPFLWKDVKADYPKAIKDLAQNLPVSHHLALKTKFEDRELFLDVTWDLPLEAGGFSVNKLVGSIIENKCAVTPLDEIVCDSAFEWINQVGLRRKESDKRLEFYLEFNGWLSFVREHYKHNF